MADKKDLEGKKVRLHDFPGQIFTLTYAGWEDQWIVKNTEWVDMLRCSGDEAIPFLIPEGYVDPEHKMEIEVNPSAVFTDVSDWSRDHKTELENAIKDSVKGLGFPGWVDVKVRY